jgi:tRNA/tmRNA/rRNA uracil-C5-methylase (TrmA/RlmC/RlmD family)
MELEITDLSRGGAGVARDDTGRVVFVPFTAPGDRVLVKISGSKKNYAQGELVEVLRPSPSRVKPPCPVFGRCGGCQWQHLPYDLQWKTKVAGAGHALARANVAVPAFEELPAERIWEYRNRVQARGEGDLLGFLEPGSQRLVPVERCWIARPEINAAWAETKREGARRTGRYKVEIEVLPDGAVRKSWNSGHAAGGFRQVHDEQNEKLRGWVGGALTKGRRLFDLFGGDGNLSLPIAREMTAVECVDTGSPREAPAGAPAGFRFDRSSVLPWLLRQSVARPTSVILDPPREGLGDGFAEIASSLERLGADELVAVGCDPDAWARDVSRFLKRGWRLERAAALDLFPQTPHVESLALLRRGL